jgi:hypothetical protein
MRICQKLLSFLPSNNMEDPPVLDGDFQVLTDPELNTIVPLEGKNLRRAQRHRPDRRQRRLPRSPGRLRHQHRDRLRPHHRAAASASSPTSRASRPARSTSTPPTSRALHPLLQRLQHPARHPRGRPRLPARRAAGIRRHHPPRRQDALRLLRGHRAQDHHHPAQGLRRRLPRHVLQGPGRRPSTPGPPPRSPSWAPRARPSRVPQGNQARA